MMWEWFWFYSVFYFSSILASRFVQCDKCRHLFVLLINEDGKKILKEHHLNQEKFNYSQKKPPPAPKKIFEYLNQHVIGKLIWMCVSKYELIFVDLIFLKIKDKIKLKKFFQSLFTIITKEFIIIHQQVKVI